MQKPNPGKMWFFVDESGDPVFYGKGRKLILGSPGVSPILLIGFAKIADPRPVRAALLELQQYVVSHPYFQKEPYIHRTKIAFHAKDDLPEVRYLVFELLASLDFSAQVIVARKVEQIFIEKDKGNPNAFYDHVVSRLFERTLHLHEHNNIYFAHRGSHPRQAPLEAAIHQGLERFREWCGPPTPTSFYVQSQYPNGEPCLAVIDYVLWAVYRAYVSRDMRFFNTVKERVSVIADIFDEARKPKHWYNRRNNPFDIEKTTPL